MVLPLPSTKAHTGAIGQAIDTIAAVNGVERGLRRGIVSAETPFACRQQGHLRQADGDQDIGEIGGQRFGSVDAVERRLPEPALPRPDDVQGDAEHSEIDSRRVNER
jgi:hypothetical protein